VKLHLITVAVFALPIDAVNGIAQTSLVSERRVSLIPADVSAVIKRAIVGEHVYVGSDSEQVLEVLVRFTRNVWAWPVTINYEVVLVAMHYKSKPPQRQTQE
jgi:hypothetical protein